MDKKCVAIAILLKIKLFTLLLHNTSEKLIIVLRNHILFTIFLETKTKFKRTIKGI